MPLNIRRRSRIWRAVRSPLPRSSSHRGPGWPRSLRAREDRRLEQYPVAFRPRLLRRLPDAVAGEFGAPGRYEVRRRRPGRTARASFDKSDRSQQHGRDRPARAVAGWPDLIASAAARASCSVWLRRERSSRRPACWCSAGPQCPRRPCGKPSKSARGSRCRSPSG